MYVVGQNVKGTHQSGVHLYMYWFLHWVFMLKLIRLHTALKEICHVPLKKIYLAN